MPLNKRHLGRSSPQRMRHVSCDMSVGVSVVGTGAVAAIVVGGAKAVTYFRKQYIAAAMVSKFVDANNDTNVLELAPKGRNLYYYPTRSRVLAYGTPKGSKDEELLKQFAMKSGVDVVAVSDAAELADESCEAVTCLTNLGDVPSVRNALAEANRVLKVGAPIILVTDPLTGVPPPVNPDDMEGLMAQPEAVRTTAAELAFAGFERIELDDKWGSSAIFPAAVGVAYKRQKKGGAGKKTTGFG